MKKSVQYFTKSLLIEFNNAAIREKRNRQLEPKYLDKLSDDIIIPIVHIFYHTKDEIRVMLALSAKPDIAFLDMSYERFQLIPTAEEDGNGSFIFQDESRLKNSFPYGDREWTQKTVKKPYRNQNKFRRCVLKAYSYQCAICDETNLHILRAAHIIPVTYGDNDIIANGICLCANHEIAFDRGLIKISSEGDIIVRDSTIQVKRSKIRYPEHKNDYPSKEFLQTKFDMS